MPVKVMVTYCGGWGYKPKFQKIKQRILAEFAGKEVKVHGFATQTVTGYLEVEVNDKLVHSKKNGDGYVDSDTKMDKIIQEIDAALEAH